MKYIVTVLMMLSFVSCGPKKHHISLSKDIDNEAYVKLNSEQKYNPIIRLHVFLKETPKSSEDNASILLTKEQEGYCSAFVVDATHAFTAAHCTPGLIVNKSTATDTTGSIEVPITNYNSNFRADFSILIGDFSKFNALITAYTVPLAIDLAGQNIAMCGYAGGAAEMVCTQGKLLSPLNSQILAAGELYPGMSGGPVLIEIPLSVQQTPQMFGVVAIGVNTASLGGNEGLPPSALLLSPLVGINAL